MVGRKKGWAPYRGRLATPKSNGSEPWKSQRVHDYLYLLEYHRDVLTYENCPLEVHHTPAGKLYIPTTYLRVCRRDSLQLVKLVSDREQTDRMAAIHLTAALNRVEEYDLRILTESEVRHHPFLICLLICREKMKVKSAPGGRNAGL